MESKKHRSRWSLDEKRRKIGANWRFRKRWHNIPITLLFQVVGCGRLVFSYLKNVAGSSTAARPSRFRFNKKAALYIIASHGRKRKIRLCTSETLGCDYSKTKNGKPFFRGNYEQIFGQPAG